MMENGDMRYLTLLAREFTNVQAASAEVINLNAILNLPKGTEHFMSDIHGEHEAFLHILNNCSGAVYERIEQVFESSLLISERRELAALIYYPREKLVEVKERVPDIDDWYNVNLKRLIQVCRLTTSNYSRSKVRKALPQDYAYIIEELLNTHDIPNKEKYYDNIIHAIIDTGMADTFVISMATFIKRMTVDTLHIVGDIFDRGPHADVILDRLIKHHSVDIQWGNHDVLWMGAAAGSPVCVATAVKNCIQYDNLDMLENAYGINLLPLALFANERYERDGSVFEPRKLPEQLYKPRDMNLYARMHKAISIIQFKLEGQLIERRPEYRMQDRDMLSRVDWEHGTIEIDAKSHALRDKNFPTVYPSAPNQLSEDEQALVDQLTNAFLNSEKLQQHVRFLYSAGSVYLCFNGNLLYHGCIPTNPDGSFMALEFGGARYSGKALLDYCDTMARRGYFGKAGSPEREEGRDFLWFLWCGRNSPIFGRKHITTFERALIDDKDTWKEPKNAYYRHYNNEEFCQKILNEFCATKPWSLIVNGHIPVKVKEGEDPRKANGKLVVIDGGFCKAYQNQTGIAGYTMFFSSLGMRIASHEPFTSMQDVLDGNDMTTHSYMVDNFAQSVFVADTDTGVELKRQIAEIMLLINAYRSGAIKPTEPKQKGA